MSNTTKKARNVAALSGGALVAASPFVATATAEAGTFTVTNRNDSGAGSLRQAVLDANSNADADTITFTADALGTITLTSGPIKIESSIDIQGPGAQLLTVDGNGNRIFYAYDNETTIDVTISGMTLTGVESTLYGGAVTLWGEHLTLEDMVITDNQTTAFGGGIFASNNTLAVLNDLSLVVRNSTISGNHAGQAGGGIALYSVPSGDTSVVLIENSTISGNTALGYGGGLLLAYGTSPVMVVNSTISGNISAFGGGAIVYARDSTLVLEHSTVTDNSAVGAPPEAGGVGPGIAESLDPFAGGILAIGSVELDHSVVSGNTAVTRADIAPYGKGPGSFTGTYSMVGDLDGTVFGGTHNLPEGDAKLGALADNGGATMTHSPLAGSPLIDAGDPAFTSPPSTDQRGSARVSNGRIDVGAVEVQAATLPPTGGSNGLMAGLGAALLGLGGALHLSGRRKRPV